MPVISYPSTLPAVGPPRRVIQSVRTHSKVSCARSQRPSHSAFAHSPAPPPASARPAAAGIAKDEPAAASSAASSHQRRERRQTRAVTARSWRMTDLPARLAASASAR
jgi:hypothetical protein